MFSARAPVAVCVCVRAVNGILVRVTPCVRSIGMRSVASCLQLCTVHHTYLQEVQPNDAAGHARLWSLIPRALRIFTGLLVACLHSLFYSLLLLFPIFYARLSIQQRRRELQAVTTYTSSLSHAG